MLVFRKIWLAFSWNTRFEIDPFCLITNDISNANLSDENIPVTVTELKHVLIFQQQLLIIIIMRKKEWSMKHRKHSLLPHKQPYIFFQTPIPFQLAKVISRCSLQKKKTFHKTTLSATERSFGWLPIEKAVVLLCSFFSFVKNSDGRSIGKTL